MTRISEQQAQPSTLGFMLELVQKNRRKTTQNSCYDHYTLPGAFSVFLLCILEFFNNLNKGLLCSQEGICTTLMKNEQLARNQEEMSQAAPAHKLDGRTASP